MSATAGVTALCSHSDLLTLNLMDTYFVSILTENTVFFIRDSTCFDVFFSFLLSFSFFCVSSTFREQTYFSSQGQIKQKFEIISFIGCWVFFFFKQAASVSAPALSTGALLEL